MISKKCITDNVVLVNEEDVDLRSNLIGALTADFSISEEGEFINSLKTFLKNLNESHPSIALKIVKCLNQ